MTTLRNSGDGVPILFGTALATNERNLGEQRSYVDRRVLRTEREGEVTRGALFPCGKGFP